MPSFRYFLPWLAWGIAACAGRPLLVPGDYQETAGPDVALFSSKQLRLYPDGHFEYFQHEDMMGAGQQGTSTYRQQGQRLQLHFTRRALGARAGARQRLLGPGPDSLVAAFQISGGYGSDSLQPVPFATVLVRDATGKVMAAVSATRSGYAELTFAPSPRPQFLEISSLEFTSWLQPWPEQPAAFHVHLAPRLGRPIPAGQIWRFRHLPTSSDGLRLVRGKDTTTFRRQALP